MNKSSTNKPRRSRKHCKRQYRKSKAATPESIIVNSNSKFQYPSKSHNNNEYIRSKSLTRIQSLDEIDTQMDHFPLKLHRIASWFKSNPMNSNTPISSANATPMETPNVTPSVKNVSRRVSSLYTRHNNYNIQEKITWRPSLNDICMDKHLSNALIEFMKRIYCEENILFLRAVQQFKCEIDQYIHFESDSDLKHNQKDTDFQIISIYNTYILSNSQYQVNLSYGNFMDSLKRKEAVSTLTIHQKKEIFDDCVKEIQRLIMSSVLPSFYDSAEFAIIAQQRAMNTRTVNPTKIEWNDSYDMDMYSTTYSDTDTDHPILALTNTASFTMKNSIGSPLCKISEGMGQSAPNVHMFENIEIDYNFKSQPIKRFSLSQSKSENFDDLKNSLCDPGPGVIIVSNKRERSNTDIIKNNNTKLEKIKIKKKIL
eukprot:704637_1